MVSSSRPHPLGSCHQVHRHPVFTATHPGGTQQTVCDVSTASVSEWLIIAVAGRDYWEDRAHAG